jgi:hypothetical protein
MRWLADSRFGCKHEWRLSLFTFDLAHSHLRLELAIATEPMCMGVPDDDRATVVVISV